MREPNPPHVSYWMKGLAVQNFGDVLSEILLAELTRKSPADPDAGEPTGAYDVVHLIGSVISGQYVRDGLARSEDRDALKIAFWGCGKRDAEPIAAEWLGHCAFLGVRGPLTRDALGLPPDTPLGDPALLMPAIYTPERDAAYAGAALCVPHFQEEKSDERLLSETGADAILRPTVTASLPEIYRFIDRLTSASFVLCGALHAAVIRCAYGLPFGYLDSGFIDVPFKWQDFSASVGIEAGFARTIGEGESWYAQEGARARAPDLEPLVACAPFKAPEALLAKARRHATSPSAP